MIWFMMFQVVSTLVELVRLGRKSEIEKDLEILLLRRQLAIYERKQDRALRLARGEKLALVVLATKLKAKTGRTIKRGQSWSTFLTNHTSETWACDCVQTYDLLFRTVFVYFIIELRSRRVVHYGVTRAPSDRWVAQQVREATPYDASPRFLIQDNDNKFGACFNRVAEERHIKVLRTPVRAPQAHAICGRFIGSVRRECLDHILILSERQLYRVMGE